MKNYSAFHMTLYFIFIQIHISSEHNSLKNILIYIQINVILMILVVLSHVKRTIDSGAARAYPADEVLASVRARRK